MSRHNGPILSAARRAAAALALISIGMGAWAQSDIPWNGFYAGLNAGDASNNTCNHWSLGNNAADAAAAAFAHANCPSGGFLGGLQVGENFQHGRLVIGLGADFDVSTAKSSNQTWISSGPGGPAGTYTAAGRLTPANFGIVSARIGYGGTMWFPYVRGGALITSGGHDDGLSYTLPGAVRPTATFDGARNYNSTGWVAGGGTEWGFNGPFSISLEYLHESLGKGPSGAAGCTGVAVTCAEFAAIALQSSHDAFNSNIIRVGVNYWFGYWNP
jgi:opacity protein-like surface antigen